MNNQKLILIIFSALIILISSCQPYKYTQENESYKFININSLDGDTVSLVTIQNYKLNGEAKILKKQGNNRGGIFDIIHRDAIYYDKWTYGEYLNNKKNGKWYSLDSNNNIILEYLYKNDTLNGDFFELSKEDTLYKGTYNDGLLDGEFLMNYNGYKLIEKKITQGKYHWKLNYKKGKLDGSQKKYFNSEIEEEILFDNGRILKINKSPNINRIELDEEGSGFIQFKEKELTDSILAQQFNKTHKSREYLIFGEGTYSGQIDFCNGYFCPKKFKLRMDKNEYIFTIEYEVKINKKYIKK